MKLGELFIQIGVKGSTQPLDRAIKSLEEAKKKFQEQQKAAEDSGKQYDTLRKYLKDLKNATTAQEKALIKKAFADKVHAVNLGKSIKLIDRNIAGHKLLKGNLDKVFGTMRAVATGVRAFATATSIAYIAVDRMVNSLSIANQKMISFQRQTGISFASLNKYASAASSVNYNATPEQMANTMQTLAQNLYDIRMGRGDISPYQELAFVGGKPFMPFNMSVEDTIENVREAIKGVSDVQATNIITRMGFSPDDLLMLRMTREEMEKFNDLFLSADEREQMNKYSLEIKKVHLQFALLKDRALLQIMPYFVRVSKHVYGITSALVGLVNKIREFISLHPMVITSFKAIGLAIAGVLAFLHPIIAGFTALYLILEDLAVWNAGGKSLFGYFFGRKGSEEFKNSWIYKLGDFFKNLANDIKECYESLGKLYHMFSSFGGGDDATPTSFADTVKGNVLLRSPLAPIYMMSKFLQGLPDMYKGSLNPQPQQNNNNNNVINQTNNMTINTTQPADKALVNGVNDYTSLAQQLMPQGV